MYSFVIDHEKEMKIQLLNAVMLRGLGPCSSKYEKIRQMFFCGFKNFHVHTYPCSNRICPSTRIRHVIEFILLPRTPLGILATEHVS